MSKPPAYGTTAADGGLRVKIIEYVEDNKCLITTF